MFFTTKSAEIWGWMEGNDLLFIVFYGKLLSELRISALGLMSKIHELIKNVRSVCIARVQIKSMMICVIVRLF